MLWRDFKEDSAWAKWFKLGADAKRNKQDVAVAAKLYWEQSGFPDIALHSITQAFKEGADNETCRD